MKTKKIAMQVVSSDRRAAWTPWAGLVLVALALGAPPRLGYAQESSESVVRPALLAAARNALRQEDLNGAIFYYVRYTQQYPDDLSVLQEYAGVLTQAGRFEEAMAVSERILRAEPSNPEALKLQAIALARLGRPQEALRLIENLRARFPDDLELQKIEAGFRALQGDRDFSRDLYRDLLRAGFNSVRDWQDYLQLLATDEQWDLLIETYDQYRTRLTENDAVRSLVLAARLARNEWSAATALYEQLQEPDRRRDAAMLMADRLAAAGRLDEAVEFLEPVVDVPNPDPNLVVKLALVEAYGQRYVRAMQRLDAIPRELRNERVAIGRVKVLWAAGQLQAAWEELDRLALPPEQVEATLARAGLLYDLEREGEMLPVLFTLLPQIQETQSMERRLAWTLLTLAHVRGGNFAAARQLVRTFQEREPADLAAPILAVVIERAARRTHAYDAAVAQLGLRLRDYQPGAELIRPALLDEIPPAAWRIARAARPGNETVLLALAEAELRVGRVAVAAELFESASSTHPDSARAVLGAMECAWRMNRDRRVRELADSLRDRPLRFPELVQAVRLLLQGGQEGVAQGFLERIPEARRDHPEAVAVRAAWLVRADRVDEARLALAAFGPANPAHVGEMLLAYRRVSALARDASDVLYTIAVGQIRTLAAAGAGGLPDAALVAADLMMQFGAHDEAVRFLSPYETLAAFDLRLNDRLLIAHIQAANYKAAEARIRRYLERRPRDAGRRGLLARISFWQSRYGQARERYEALLADYPEDVLFPQEWAAKHNRALSRHRKSVSHYDNYVARQPADREMAVERADSWYLRSLPRSAADQYEEVTWAYPDNLPVRDAHATARRETHVGVGGAFGRDRRQGRDDKVDVDMRQAEAFVRLPRGPDGLNLEVGVGRTRFDFRDPEAESLDANHLFARGRWHFATGWEAAGRIEATDHDTLDSSLGAELDLGYRGLDGWKVAGLIGQEEIRDNYFTLNAGLMRSWLGAYAQWQPTERLELFGQYRHLNLDGPPPGSPLPSNEDIRESDQTFEDNRAHEVIAEGIAHIFFFPHSLRVWVNVYGYRTENDNEMYWTPEDPFWVGQGGLHWRHHLGRRHFVGSPYLFYGAYAAMARDSEGENAPMLKGELGLRTRFGLTAGAEVLRIWGDDYEERAARIFAGYQF
ncbi:MAG: tetratricopeptide repeat protein [Candidatus Marinimicrobia bacterium]|nr:tetratricopeptide repeat protein [Candidatus Neomarinimicrobiota bacterium]